MARWDDTSHERRGQARELRHRLLQFLGLAILIHLALLPPLGLLIPKAGPITHRKLRVVALLGPNVTGKRLKHPPQVEVEHKKKAQPPEKKKPPKPEKLKGQVVDVPPSPDDTPPKDARFLSEYNTHTEHETASRYSSPNYHNAMNEPSTTMRSQSTTPNPTPKAQAIEQGKANPAHARKTQHAATGRDFELPTLKQRDRLALELDPKLGEFHNQRHSARLHGNGDRLRLSWGKGKKSQQGAKAPHKGANVTKLFPSIGVLAQISGAPANDYLKDIDKGDGTFLNSRQFKYASFFNRLKRGVSEHWRPLAEYRRRDPTGNIYGYRSRVTILDVTLDATGRLQDVEVSHSSGVAFLDREAIAAFQRAQPFPNPPKGLIDRNTGLISFPFGFHIDFNDGGMHLPF